MEPFNSHNHNTFLVEISSILQDNHILMENSSSSLETHQQFAHEKRKTSEENSTGSFQSKNKKRKEPTSDKVKNGEKRDDEPIMEGEISKGYIRVRARRGQATDSHSIAERIRREKISARMKALQDLVPGCDKVIGKASMLDEIINYVLSLQNQVEVMAQNKLRQCYTIFSNNFKFLSMKLASVMPMTGHDYCLKLYEQTESFLEPTLISGEISNTQHDSAMFALP